MSYEHVSDISDSESMELESYPTVGDIKLPAGEVIRQIGFYLTHRHPERTIVVKNRCDWKKALDLAIWELDADYVAPTIELKPMTAEQKEIIEQMSLENVRGDPETGWASDLSDTQRRMLAPTPSSMPSLVSDHGSNSPSSSSPSPPSFASSSPRSPVPTQAPAQQADPTPTQPAAHALSFSTCSRCEFYRMRLDDNLTEAALGIRITYGVLIMIAILILMTISSIPGRPEECTIPKDVFAKCGENA